jgi:hypothetical protein
VPVRRKRAARPGQLANDQKALVLQAKTTLN